jgi:hypothetical protein
VNEDGTSQDDARREEARKILEAIRRDFDEVRPECAITLHETLELDGCGAVQAGLAARKRDTDKHWWEVRDEWLGEVNGIGGLSFLNDAGFRYYLPAYMSYWLRTGYEPGCLRYFIAGSRKYRYRLFNAAQRVTIARFVKFVHRRFPPLGNPSIE